MVVSNIIKDRVLKTYSNLTTILPALITAALTLVAALAWNNAAQELINSIAPTEAENFWSKLFYALVITIIVSVILAQFSSPNITIN